MNDLKTHLKKYSCQLLAEETSHDDLRERDHELPTDTHLVRVDDQIMAIRAFKMSDIFDALFDQGMQIHEISQGYGTLRPNMFGSLD